MQVCAISPMMISRWIACFLSCKSKRVLAKPLEHQLSVATISPGSGAKLGTDLTAPAAVCEALVHPRGFLNGRNILPRLIVARTISMMHGIEDPKFRLA